MCNRDLPRLYVEAKSFLKLRAQRNRMVKDSRSQTGRTAGSGGRGRVAEPDFSESRADAIAPPCDFFRPSTSRLHQILNRWLITNFLPRQYLILGLVAVCAPLGDTCLSRGMTGLPAITLAHPATLIAAVFTPWIALGIALLIGFFASYLTALSWADLTFVLPATAFGNVIVALLVALLSA